MPTVDKHPHGAPCWFELGTTDQEAAKAFYSGLFGWDIFEAPMPGMPDAKYTLFRLQGKDVGGCYKLMPQMLQQGVPPHWAIYFCTSSVDQALSKAQALGGKIIEGPMDIPDVGRMAVCQDPTGAFFHLYEPGRHSGVGLLNESNTIGWSELATRDVPKAAEFYSSLLGWKTTPSANMPTDLEFDVAGEFRGGLLPMDDSWGPIPPHWGIYVLVDDAKAVTARLKQLGGAVRHGPFEAPGVGWITIAADPQGAGFSIIQLFRPTQTVS